MNSICFHVFLPILKKLEKMNMLEMDSIDEP